MSDIVTAYSRIDIFVPKRLFPGEYMLDAV